MDAAATSSAMKHQETLYQANLKVANMAKGQMEQTGKDIMKLLDSTKVNQANHPYKGQNVDVSVY
ncbi:YjfB family protein [Halanaerobacter jeridensis]|uniref:Motility protein n=1 Tax=Halanaerobacter jeridensis TaxID=706427 RepID=A0A939BS13_9FIRM|nr:YjfB family protein [Halanaerobacter jeridensis]MBM7557889.1 hypothetical protein [Halanaerobacter jeridensis]